MRASFFLASLASVPLCGSALVGPPGAMHGILCFRARAPASPSLCAIDQKSLYDKIDVALRRAKREEAPALSVRTARALSQRWLEMPPADLVEALFVSGALVLDGFDEGLEILLQAEEQSELTVSSKAYYALCRLAIAEERPQDVLYMLGRASSRGVQRTDGLLLVGMQAATAMEDWGAVARLYAELSMGPEAAAMQAVVLESFAEPAILEDILRATPLAATPVDESASEVSQALVLALRAHCERGDVAQVMKVIERIRAGATPLGLSEYVHLVMLAKRTSRPDILLALSLDDISRTAKRTLEPTVFAASNRVGVALASLGTVERAVVSGMAGVVLVAAALAFFVGSLDSASQVDDVLNF